jgi:hypothetical protein
MRRLLKILVIDLDETEATNLHAGEGQQQFNRPTIPVFM